MIHSSVLCLLFTFQIVYAVHDYKKCNISSWINGCPASTKCSQIAESNSSSYAGECHCIGDNYEFNKYYKNDSDYCLFVDNRVMASKSSSTHSDQDTVDNPVSSHHILGGIFISICLVVMFTLIVIGVRKLQIKQRIRNLRMTQRNRPLYEDVMMGNDTDDPPLI
ncbi:hypothetical protein HA402_001407 [Bradysia odoriphaga]|nr:hypothetical protein HA402_001407 [Bradysia odoriphaga]